MAIASWLPLRKTHSRRLRCSINLSGDIPNFANGGAEFTDARTVTPARPRAFYAGLKATF
jgi:hypothetical protein